MGMTCILFSPIGTTDPISNYRDGAMLHIVRKYKPSKVYLYLSKEMCELNDRDKRYEIAVELLAKRLGISIEVSVIRREELTEVHLFDYFYNEFEEIIRMTAEENPDSVLLLNVSSGTPAMKSALQTLAALTSSKSIRPIQVSTPAKSSNQRDQEFNGLDLATAWELNEDNDEEYVDRTDISTNLNLRSKIKRESLIKHLEAYDYNAALSVAKEIEHYIPKEAMSLLEAAHARVQLDTARLTKTLSGTKIKENEFIPIMDSSLRNMAEYLLSLEIKLKRAEYADFIRAITPLVSDIFELYISNRLKINIRKFCYIGRASADSKTILRKSMMESDTLGSQILRAFDNHFREGYIEKDCSSEHLLVIIKDFSQNSPVAKLAEEIREVEKNCRNIAAHEIVSMTPKTVYEKSNYYPKDIMKMMFDMADASGISRSKLNGSYDDMNRLIIKAIGVL